VNNENTLDYILRNSSYSLRDLFDELRKNIKNLGYIREEPRSGRYWCFYTDSSRSSKFAEIEPLSSRNCLSILVKTDKSQTDDDEEFALLMPESFKWGKCKKLIIIESTQVEKAMRYFQEAYKLKCK
jgi:predicted transport protein